MISVAARAPDSVRNWVYGTAAFGWSRFCSTMIVGTTIAPTSSELAKANGRLTIFSLSNSTPATKLWWKPAVSNSPDASVALAHVAAAALRFCVLARTVHLAGSGSLMFGDSRTVAMYALSVLP